MVRRTVLTSDIASSAQDAGAPSGLDYFGLGGRQEFRAVGSTLRARCHLLRAAGLLGESPHLQQGRGRIATGFNSDFMSLRTTIIGQSTPTRVLSSLRRSGHFFTQQPVQVLEACSANRMASAAVFGPARAWSSPDIREDTLGSRGRRRTPTGLSAHQPVELVR